MSVEALVREHLHVVGYVVRETMNRVPAHVHRDDLVSAGMAGLAHAATKYDPTTGVPFARYAATRVRGAVTDELRAMDWVSRGTRTRAREITAVEDTLTARQGRRPSSDEVAAALGVDAAELDRRRADADRTVLSLDDTDGGYGSFDVADPDDGPEARLLHTERLRYLRATLAALPQRHRAVAEGLYLQQRSITELAAELGVTESRISQVRTEAMELLRDGMNSQLDPHLVPAPRRPDGAVARRRHALYAQVAENVTRSGGEKTLRSPPRPSM